MENTKKISIKKNKSNNNWKRDGVEFDLWFAGQSYSLGAIPNWAQVAEMRRVWCIARQTLRER